MQTEEIEYRLYPEASEDLPLEDESSQQVEPAYPTDAKVRQKANIIAGHKPKKKKIPV